MRPMRRRPALSAALFVGLVSIAAPLVLAPAAHAQGKERSGTLLDITFTPETRRPDGVLPSDETPRKAGDGHNGASSPAGADIAQAPGRPER